MSGIIFELLEQAVTRWYGPDAWTRMLAEVRSSGYLPSHNYPDDELFALLGALPITPESTFAERLRWFGRAVIPLLAERYPPLFAPHSSAESFLLALNQILHPSGPPAHVEVGPLDLEVMVIGPGGGLIVEYRSARRELCALAEGFVTGAADHYGQRVRIDQPRCALRGDERCALVCLFDPAA